MTRAFSRLLIVLIIAASLPGCITMTTVDGRPTDQALALARDLGFSASALMPDYQAELDLACEAFRAVTGSENQRQAMIDIVSKLWTQAEEQKVVAVALLANNLIGLSGIMDGDKSTSVYVVALMDAFCLGVKQ